MSERLRGGGNRGEPEERLDPVLQRALHELEPPPLPAGFELALRHRLVAAAGADEQRAQAPRHARRIVAAALAAAAVALLALGSTWRGPRPRPALLLPPPVVAEAPAPATVTHQLEIAVRATLSRPRTLFELELAEGAALPPGLASLGRGARVSWRSDLRAGVNVIALPLRVRAPAAQVRLVSRLAVDGGPGLVVETRSATAADGERLVSDALAALRAPAAGDRHAAIVPRLVSVSVARAGERPAARLAPALPVRRLAPRPPPSAPAPVAAVADESGARRARLRAELLVEGQRLLGRSDDRGSRESAPGGGRAHGTTATRLHALPRSSAPGPQHHGHAHDAERCTMEGHRHHGHQAGQPHLDGMHDRMHGMPGGKMPSMPGMPGMR